MSPADFSLAFSDTIGRGPSAEDINTWYPRRLSEPGVLGNYDAATNWLMAWNECCNFENIMQSVVSNIYGWTLNTGDRNQLTQLVKAKIVPYHYTKLLRYLISNPLIPVDRFVTIASLASGKVLEVAGGGPRETGVQQWEYKGLAHQRWKLPIREPEPVTSAKPGIKRRTAL